MHVYLQQVLSIMNGQYGKHLKIPRTMSTQHPDNVHTPFFTENIELTGEDEVKEAYYVYSHLGCTEQMWDCEGKEVDNYVVKKLLSRYGNYFPGSPSWARSISDSSCSKPGY